MTPLDSPTLAAACCLLYTRGPDRPALFESHPVESAARRAVERRRRALGLSDAGLQRLVDDGLARLNAVTPRTTVGVAPGVAAHLVFTALWLAWLDPCPPWAADLRAALSALDAALCRYATRADEATTARAADATRDAVGAL